jgi:adenosine kinase
MNIALTGSIAFDYLMTFPGRFHDHFLLEKLDKISLSFLVDSLACRKGGIAANIAFNLALLGEKATILAAVGEDFDEFRAWLEENQVDTSHIHVIPGTSTASFFVTTDQTNAQIASFYTGAMAHAAELPLSTLDERPSLVMISPNDPQAMVNYVKECSEQDIRYIYDPSQQIVRLDPPDLRQGIENCQALFGNDYEFGLIKDKTGFSLNDIRAHTDLVVMTCGSSGAEVYSDSGRVQIPVVEPETIADPTGVGDAFRGGFLKGYINGLSPERCGQMGALAATYCLESDGPMGHNYDLPTFVTRFRKYFDDQDELDQLK